MGVNPADRRLPRLPPPWFIHAAWRVHRGLYKISRGRFLWSPRNKRGWGALCLTTTGRTTGHDRTVIVGYLEDGANLVLIAMNGWDEGDPSWCLNLKADPRARVRLANHEERAVRARLTDGAERDRLWQLWVDVDASLDAYAAARSTVTPVILLEPIGN